MNDEGRAAPQPLYGRTRLQKLLFLVQEEINKAGNGGGRAFKFDYEYEAEKFGPADLQLYQDLEFLNAMGLIAIDGVAREAPAVRNAQPSLADLVSAKSHTLRHEPTLPEEEEEDGLSFSYLMGHEPEEYMIAEAEDEEVETEYAITHRGTDMLQRIRKRMQAEDQEEVDRFDKTMAICASVREQFGKLPLKSLLRHVYRTYPDKTSRSIIKGDLF